MHKTPSLNKPPYLNKQHYGITITLLAILSYSTAWANTNNGFTLEQGDLVVEDGTVKAPRFVGGGSTPIGSVTAFMGTSVPENWKEANGESLSRTTYPELYAQIGDRYGSDDSLSFNLPDLRGEFIRGWDNGRGVDTGRQLGSYQIDEFKSHTHNFTKRSGACVSSINEQREARGGCASWNYAMTTNSSGGSESRPRNIAVMYIIRVK